MSDVATSYPQVIFADFTAKSKITGLESLEFSLLCKVDEGQTPQQVADRLLEAEFIGKETMNMLRVITRESNCLVIAKLDGSEEKRSPILSEETVK